MEHQNKKKQSLIILITILVATIIFLGAWLIYIHYTFILVWKNVGSTYYVDNNAIIRLDLTDVNQLILLHKIEDTCLKSNIKNCQSGISRLKYG